MERANMRTTRQPSRTGVHGRELYLFVALYNHPTDLISSPTAADLKGCGLIAGRIRELVAKTVARSVHVVRFR
jgi:hypothetical protein